MYVTVCYVQSSVDTTLSYDDKISNGSIVQGATEGNKQSLAIHCFARKKPSVTCREKYKCRLRWSNIASGFQTLNNKTVRRLGPNQSSGCIPLLSVL